MVALDRTRYLSGELLALLREELATPELDFDGDPVALTGGFWAELISFRLRDAPHGWSQDLVARVMPDPGIAAKEITCQRGAAAQCFPTPAVRFERTPGEGIDGRAVMVMDRAQGAPLLGGLDGIAAIGKLPSLARRLPLVLAEALARLHALDPEPIASELSGRHITIGINTMLVGYHAIAEAAGRTALRDCAAWLADHRPASAAAVLCHGDMHPFNVLVDDASNFTVLDWSAAVLAPRAYDLAFTSLMLAEPPLVVPSPLRPVVRRAGSWLSQRFLRAYEAAAGLRIDAAALAWFHGLICVRALSEVAQWAAAGELASRTGHPWVINQDAFIRRLQAISGIAPPLEI